MSIVNAPLNERLTDPVASSTYTVRAMQVGQHVMAALLSTIGVIRAGNDGTAWALAILAGVAIVGWHTAGSLISSKQPSQKRLTGWLLGLALIWAAAVWLSAEFVWVAFLLWLLAGHLLPWRWALLFSVCVYGLVAAAPWLHHGTTTYANVFGPLIGGVFAFGISRGYLQLLREAAQRQKLVDSLTRAQEEMADLQDELALASRHSGQMAERVRISRDLHDTVAQSLSSIRLISHAGLQQGPDETPATLHQIERLAGESLKDVRGIIASLVPTALQDDALLTALGKILLRLEEETTITTSLRGDDTLPLLPIEVEIALLRTAQSALANVRSHANASTVTVRLTDAQDSVRLDITDDGGGFDVARWENHRPTESSSFGLRFMRARLRELGGGLDVESTPGEGTAISAYLPLQLR